MPSRAMRRNCAASAIWQCCSVWRWSGRGCAISACSTASSATSVASSPLVWMCSWQPARWNSSTSAASASGEVTQMPFGAPLKYPGQRSRAVKPWIEPSTTSLTAPMRSRSWPEAIARRRPSTVAGCEASIER